MQKLTLPKLESEVKEIVVRDRELIARKQAEMRSGLDPNGNPIGEYQSDSYREFKRRMNPLAGGKVDLILTGSTKNQLFVKPQGNGMFDLKSQDDKWDDLVEKYGEKIEGINKEVFDNRQKFDYAPKLIEWMKKTSGIT